MARIQTAKISPCYIYEAAIVAIYCPLKIGAVWALATWPPYISNRILPATESFLLHEKIIQWI